MEAEPQVIRGGRDLSRFVSEGGLEEDVIWMLHVVPSQVRLRPELFAPYCR